MPRDALASAKTPIDEGSFRMKETRITPGMLDIPELWQPLDPSVVSEEVQERSRLLGIDLGGLRAFRGSAKQSMLLLTPPPDRTGDDQFQACRDLRRRAMDALPEAAIRLSREPASPSDTGWGLVISWADNGRPPASNDQKRIAQGLWSFLNSPGRDMEKVAIAFEMGADALRTCRPLARHELAFTGRARHTAWQVGHALMRRNAFVGNTILDGLQGMNQVRGRDVQTWFALVPEIQPDLPETLDGMASAFWHLARRDYRVPVGIAFEYFTGSNIILRLGYSVESVARAVQGEGVATASDAWKEGLRMTAYTACQVLETAPAGMPIDFDCLADGTDDLCRVLDDARAAQAPDHPHLVVDGLQRMAAELRRIHGQLVAAPSGARIVWPFTSSERQAASDFLDDGPDGEAGIWNSPGDDERIHVAGGMAMAR